MEKYCVVRVYFDSDRFPSHLVFGNLELADAQNWCNSDETCSDTCGASGDIITRDCGPWFDCYTKEENFK